MWSTRERGAEAERKAARYLKKQGYRILERNRTFGKAEIDLIAREGKTLVFVEVKSRHAAHAISVASAVDRRKQGHLIRAARSYLRAEYAGKEKPLCRFDVVCICEDELVLYRSAFEVPSGF